MSLSSAIAKKDINELETTVKAAVEIYNTACPKEVSVDTAFGQLPFSAIWDEDTKWAVIGAAYADVVQQVSKISKDLDKNIETAKIISQNAVLRNVSSTGPSTEGLL